MSIVYFSHKSPSDGLEISAVAVLPAGRPVALLQVAHGMCGSKERFMPFMKFMAERGVACFANDHRGHGDSVRSSGDLGYMYGGGHEAVVADMLAVSRQIRTEYEDIPFFVLGHSMGSMAVRAYLKAYPEGIDGVILCGSPGVSPFASLGYRLASIGCRFGFGRFRPGFIQRLTSDVYNRRFESEGRQAWTCSDPAVRKVFSDDPRHNFSFTLDGARTLLALMLQAYSPKGWKVTHPELPVLFLSGNDDPCMGGPSGLEKAAAVLREAGYRRISAKIYPSMRHEILNEIGKEGVWRDIIEFMGL